MVHSSCFNMVVYTLLFIFAHCAAVALPTHYSHYSSSKSYARFILLHKHILLRCWYLYTFTLLQLQFLRVYHILDDKVWPSSLAVDCGLFTVKTNMWRSFSDMEPLCSGHRVSLPGRGVDHPLPSSVEFKERVELYLHSLSGPSCQVMRWT
jgi:hypothetical protein